MKNYDKYKIVYDWKKPKNRTWVDNEIKKAPIWCSVDLRDGNQALANPMTLEEKIEFFKYLIKIGFKEIEIGFPAASETEYKCTRYLIENNLIPDDVKIQVLTQSREEIIKKTFEALEGAKNAIVHLYNSTSKIQREVVFRKDKDEIKKIATDGAKIITEYIKKYPNTNWQLEYSPESFTATEMDYALDVVNAVLDIWKDKTKNKPIINFPATVECSTPNIFADQIQYIAENIKDRDGMIISIHSHNDRGTGVATSEMAMLAGADRIEGSLLGNGERTGNADILNIAMNMFVTGVDPELDFSNLNALKQVYERNVKMPISPRHPYIGDLVFTAFSGSHQDAIAKGLKNLENNNYKYWDVPYLPINPADVNRQYEPIIRINSQSGKGGVMFLLEKEYGFEIPTEMKKHVGAFIKRVSDEKGRELEVKEIYDAFKNEYINRNDIIDLKEFSIKSEQNDKTKIEVIFDKKGEKIKKEATGNGPVEAFVDILKQLDYKFKFEFYSQDSQSEKIKSDETANAITYIKLINDETGREVWAIGKDRSTVKSSFEAIISAINRM